MAKIEIPAKTVIKCDRCKKEDEEGKGVLKDPVVQLSVTEAGSEEAKYYDLCNSCRDIFKKFINMTRGKSDSKKRKNGDVGEGGANQGSN